MTNHINNTAFLVNISLNVTNSPVIVGKVKSIAVEPADIMTFGDFPYVSFTLSMRERVLVST